MKLYLSAPHPPFLRESTANWQPVITIHLPCSALVLHSTFFSEHSHGIFLNWPLGNSIYLRSVAAEFALSSIGFGEIGVKTPDKIMKVGILLEPRNKWCLWAEAMDPSMNFAIGCQLRWVGVRSAPTLCLQRKQGSYTQGTSKTRAHQANWYRHVYTPYHFFFLSRVFVHRGEEETDYFTRHLYKQDST